MPRRRLLADRAHGPAWRAGSRAIFCIGRRLRHEERAGMNIGFIGLGNMGSAIAGRLLEAGHSLHVWNRSPLPARRLAERGARVAATAEDAFRGEIVFSMLSDDAATRAVLVDSGIVGGAAAAAVRVHVNMATISAALADELAEMHRERGIGYVAAPVLGRPDAAAAGKLTVVLAGPRQAMESVQPLLE